jgi:hypothetical protein
MFTVRSLKVWCSEIRVVEGSIGGDRPHPHPKLIALSSGNSPSFRRAEFPELLSDFSGALKLDHQQMRAGRQAYAVTAWVPRYTTNWREWLEVR